LRRSLPRASNPEFIRYSQIHHQLCSALEDLKSIYGFQLLVLLTTCFSVITNGLYGITNRVLRFKTFSVDFAYEAFELSIWLGLVSYEIFVLANVCHKVSNEVGSSNE
jgi:hypothetical protein